MNNPNALNMNDLTKDTGPDERDTPIRLNLSDGTQAIMTRKLGFTIIEDSNGRQSWYDMDVEIIEQPTHPDQQHLKF